MKKFLVLMILAGMMMPGFAQNDNSWFKTVPADLRDAPEWARLMYSPDPHVGEVEFKYHQYYLAHPFEKNIHTQNFKHWMMIISGKVNGEGRIRPDTLSHLPETRKELKSGTPEWHPFGPMNTYAFPEQGGHEVSWQANVYCFDQCVAEPYVCFAGIEGGGLYKSINRGVSWSLVTRLVKTSTIDDVKVAPGNANVVYFTSEEKIYRSLDGGINWELVLIIGDRGLQLLIHPNDDQRIFCVAENGLFRSLDGGESWTKLVSTTCWDIAFHPQNPDIVYLLKTNPSAKRAELFKSVNGGDSFDIRDSGWYVPADIAKANDIGGKIGVSPADPDRVYVALIGESKEGDNGWIGVYRSNDAGETWVNPNLPDGGPFNAGTHPNLASSHPNGTGFHQGFFNFALAVSHQDADVLWIGTLSLNRSVDGGKRWLRIGSYNAQEDIGWIHPDIQDLHVLDNEVWVCTDGGINYSTDELRTHRTRNTGLAGSNFWGFGQGWNEDVLVGGRYHNGNYGYHENYEKGNSLRLGGAEAPTGYVNPQFNRLTYFSDISSQMLPLELTGRQTHLPKLSLYPNEAYTESHSSEMEFDPRYSDHIYIGSGGALFKSVNGGAYFEVLYDFGSSARVLEIEISRVNPDVIYVVSQPSGGYWDACSIYRSEDGGQSFTRMTYVPTSSRWRTEISLNPENENELWVMSIAGSNGRKVYRTLDGGVSWENMTTENLDNHRPQDIQYQAGTNGIVYLATSTGMFYYDPELKDWVDFSYGLPVHTRALEMRPFYAKNMIRMATQGHAIWEAGMVADSRPMAQPMTKTDTIYRALDTVSFDSYSVVLADGAAYSWSFSPAPQWVSDLNERHPKVIFGREGSFDVSLTVTDRSGLSDTRMIESMVTVLDVSGVDLEAGFAMETYGAGDYMATEDFGISTETLTITAWVRPDGIQPDYTGIAINNGEAAGFNFRGGNNTLGYHWPGGQWYWDSGLVVQPYRWSHVAIVADRDKVVVYVNGIGVTHHTDIAPVMLQTFNIGNYQGWTSRNFVGAMDEICFWKKALTRDEIRLSMHLTREDHIDDPDLLAYYQFNEPKGSVLDKSGSLHGNLYGKTKRVVSGAPVGSGSSAAETVDFGTTYDFEGTGLSISVPTYGKKPNGEVVVTRISGVPNELPNDHPSVESWWIIDNYGDQEFTALSSIRFTVSSQPSEEVLGQPSIARLYKRRSDSYLNAWEGLCVAQSVYGEQSATFQYDGSCQFTTFGHYFIVSDDQATPLIKSEGTGIGGIEGIHENVFLFPNPASPGTTLKLKADQVENFRLSLFSTDGRMVHDQLFTGDGTMEIPTDHLRAGVYMYTIRSRNFIRNGLLILH